jgi:hypothetical protein
MAVVSVLGAGLGAEVGVGRPEPDLNVVKGGLRRNEMAIFGFRWGVVLRSWTGVDEVGLDEADVSVLDGTMDVFLGSIFLFVKVNPLFLGLGYMEWDTAGLKSCGSNRGRIVFAC